MLRNSSLSPLRGSRLLQALGSASQIASRLPGVSVRSIQGWQSGGKPSARNRQLLETVLGIPETAWHPEPTAFEAALAQRLAAVIAAALQGVQGQVPAAPLSPSQVGVTLLAGHQERAAKGLREAVSGTPEAAEAQAEFLAVSAALEHVCEGMLRAGGGQPS